MNSLSDSENQYKLGDHESRVSSDHPFEYGGEREIINKLPQQDEKRISFNYMRSTNPDSK